MVERTNERTNPQVAAHLGDTSTAEEIYRSVDRMDLALTMYRAMGDWRRVARLCGSAGGGGGYGLGATLNGDALLDEAHLNIGTSEAEGGNHARAAEYFREARSLEAQSSLCRSLFLAGDYDGLNKMTKSLPQGSPLLLQVGARLASVGMAEEAADALVKGGDAKKAVDTCVLLNAWGRAVELAKVSELN